MSLPSPYFLPNNSSPSFEWPSSSSSPTPTVSEPSAPLVPSSSTISLDYLNNRQQEYSQYIHYNFSSNTSTDESDGISDGMQSSRQSSDHSGNRESAEGKHSVDHAESSESADSPHPTDSKLSKKERNKISATAYRKRRKQFLDGLEVELQMSRETAQRERAERLKIQNELKVAKMHIEFLQQFVGGKISQQTTATQPLVIKAERKEIAEFYGMDPKEFDDQTIGKSFSPFLEAEMQRNHMVNSENNNTNTINNNNNNNPQNANVNNNMSLVF